MGPKLNKATYLKAVTQSLWTYADQHHKGKLDGKMRQGRPPFLSTQYASRNVLVPSDETKADDIRAAIPCSQRHQKFCSLKSSQALSQSVFGALCAFSRLDLLENVAAECGRPAFFDDHRDWTLAFEYKVRSLKEPTPTSVDVLLCRPGRRVAVECKFTEGEFGCCSRTSKNNYPDPKKYCDGNYRVQGGRCHRCALTEIGIRYWDHLPRLFNWPSERDHEPCPFKGVYQLARNALAATITPEGELDPNGGHMLIVYDARNPAFQANGKAKAQWEDAVGASLHQGLLRRLSWQRLLDSLACVQDLAYLVNGLREKYGLEPDQASASTPALM